MENATDALKMAFAVLIFVIALSITFILIGYTKETADTILSYSDRTSYMDPDEGKRLVSVDTVISALKNRVDQASYIVIEENGLQYIDENGNAKTTNTFTYKTTSDDKQVQKYIETHVDKGYKYTETVREIVTDGEYIVTEDGTRLAISPGGVSRRYVIFKRESEE